MYYCRSARVGPRGTDVFLGAFRALVTRPLGHSTLTHTFLLNQATSFSTLAYRSTQRGIVDLIDREATLGHHFLEMAITPRSPQAPPDTHDDDLIREMTPSEQRRSALAHPLHPNREVSSRFATTRRRPQRRRSAYTISGRGKLHTNSVPNCAIGERRGHAAAQRVHHSTPKSFTYLLPVMPAPYVFDSRRSDDRLLSSPTTPHSRASVDRNGVRRGKRSVRVKAKPHGG